MYNFSLGSGAKESNYRYESDLRSKSVEEKHFWMMREIVERRVRVRMERLQSSRDRGRGRKEHLERGGWERWDRIVKMRKEYCEGGEESAMTMRLKSRHRMFLIGLCSLACSERTGQVSAGDGSHLSLSGLGCRQHRVCYQWNSLIPITVYTHCLLPWHQSTTLLSICWWSDKSKWLKEPQRTGSLFMATGLCVASPWTRW